ncbi:hypothetical protein KJ966_22055 [bacterium]|nr:hypothetical protein [bacterium]
MKNRITKAIVCLLFILAASGFSVVQESSFQRQVVAHNQFKIQYKGVITPYSFYTEEEMQDCEFIPEYPSICIMLV